MSKIILSILWLLIATNCLAVSNNPEHENLVKLAEIYSANINGVGKEFKKAVEKLRTPGLNHIIDALIASGQADKKLLSKKFLSKPSNQELQYWYVLREIHYNNIKKTKERKNNKLIAHEVLNQEIDERWLLDNYYYRIMPGVAKLFNNKDLSKYDFDLNSYGLKNETEKAILFFALIDATAQRMRVLQYLNNYKKAIEFAHKLPTFNGKPYYYYKEFEFEDFSWIGYDKVEDYKTRNLGSLFSYLTTHFSAYAEQGHQEKLMSLYSNSILSQPKYFKYSGIESDLMEIYNKFKR